MQAPSVPLLDPGENPPEECWLLDDWLEPELPEPPGYAEFLAQLLGQTAAPTSISGIG